MIDPKNLKTGIVILSNQNLLVYFSVVTNPPEESGNTVYHYRKSRLDVNGAAHA